MLRNRNYAVLIPSYCPDESLPALTATLLEKDFASVLIVDDGSGPAYAPLFKALVGMGARVVCHAHNRGKGSALKTGMRALMNMVPNLEGIITADDDGQHAPEDICRVARSLTENPQSLILGTRDFTNIDVPLKSRIGNRFASLYFKLSTRISCPDTQTGLRATPSSLFTLALSTHGNRYEYEMAFLTAVAGRGVPLHFIPIQTIYYHRNIRSHFRPFADSVLIFMMMFTTLRERTSRNKRIL